MVQLSGTTRTLAVSLMKIDAAGHEGAVIEGADAVIRRSKPIIVWKSLGRNDSSTAERLQTLGYSAEKLSPSEWIFFPS